MSSCIWFLLGRRSRRPLRLPLQRLHRQTPRRYSLLARAAFAPHPELGSFAAPPAHASFVMSAGRRLPAGRTAQASSRPYGSGRLDDNVKEKYDRTFSMEQIKSGLPRAARKESYNLERRSRTLQDCRRGGPFDTEERRRTRAVERTETATARFPRAHRQHH